MNNSLIGIIHIKQGDSSSFRSGSGLGNKRLAAGHQCLVRAPGAGIDNMVCHRKNTRGVCNLAARLCQRIQSYGAGPFVEKYAVNSDQRAVAG